MPNKETIFATLRSMSFGAAAVVATAGAFGAGVYAIATMQAPETPAAVAIAAPITVLLPPERLVAQSAILYDLSNSRVLYQKNAYDSLPLASLTKLMASEVVLSIQSPDMPVIITEKDLRPYGDWGLVVGEVVTLGELLELSLIASSNDAIEAAVNSLGERPIEKMNEAAAALGLTKTTFYNASGLDLSATEAGAYGSAYDIARLAGIFYRDHSEYFEMTTRTEARISERSEAITAEATTIPLQHIPGFVGAKTGYTELAGGNLVAVFDLEPGHTVVAAVLGSTRDGRFTDVEALIAAARAAL